MINSLLFTNGRIQTMIRCSRKNAPMSYSSAAFRIRSNIRLEKLSSFTPTIFSFSPRKKEFVRNRVLYFSTGPSFGNQSCDENKLGNRSHDRHNYQDLHKYQQLSTTTRPSIEILARQFQNSLANESMNKNLPLIAHHPFIIKTQHCRRYFCKMINSRVATAIGSPPLSPRAPPAFISSTLMPLSTSTSTTATMEKTEQKNENKNIKQIKSTTPTPIKESSDEEKKSNGSKSDTPNMNSKSKTDEEMSWKRVRTIKVPKYGPDAEKAVRSLQSARKERARVKTSINVQRALAGNLIICCAKLGAWMSSGSSSMMSEFVHSVVDCGNQALLLVGLRHTQNVADKRHPYGYGKSVYFWALVSALGTFFMGAGVSMSHSVQTLFHPTLTESISNEVWFVLAMSFVIDGYVLSKTFLEIEDARPKGVPMAKYISKLRDPATLAVLLEDGAACLGIVIAIAGLAASYASCNPIYDGIAGVGISCLLGGVGLALVRVNHSFLIGQAVEREMLDNIEQIIRNRRSIDNVSGIQSQWTGPETFSFKAELDFDGTYLSALLVPRYRAEFRSAGDNIEEDLEVLLSWYAEDVIRAVEREVRHIEAVIRQQYPGAEYIELEPMSKYVDRFAIDDSFEEKLLMIEKKELKKWVRVLYENKEENAWKTVTSSNNSSDSAGGNVISGSVPTDTMPGNGSTPGDNVEK